MKRRVLKFIGIFIASVLTLLVTGLLLFKFLGPSYLMPYVIKKVEKETNGRYTLSVHSDSLKIHFISMSFRLGQVEFLRNPKTDAYSNTQFLNQFDVHAKFESFNIKSINIINFVLSKKLVVDGISLINPEIVIRKNLRYDADLDKDKKQSDDKIGTNYVPGADTVLADTLAWEEFTRSGGSILPPLLVKQVKIEDGHFSFYGGKVPYPIHQIHGLSFDVTSLQRLTQKDFKVEDLFVSIKSASSLISKNSARISVQGINLNPTAFRIDSVHFGHIVDKYKVNQLKGFRASWLNIGAKDIDMDGLHLKTLLNDSLLIIDKATIGKFRLYLFKDKEHPKINPAYKPMPQEIIRSIPIGLKIDAFEIISSDLIIDMEAPKAKAPGQITLNQTNAMITNITNIPVFLEKDAIMEIHLSTKILNQIPLILEYKLNIESKEDDFQAAGKVDPFEASILNGFLGSQFFIEFKTGHIDNLEFSFKGNNKANVGEMDFEYTHLKMQKLKGYEAYIENKPKTGFLSVVGNILIHNNRSKNDKKYKPGAIYYEKEFNRPMIHGTIMSVLSGVLSSMGITSRNIEKKQQKADALDDTAIIKSEATIIKQGDKIDKKEENLQEKEVKKGEKEAKKEAKKETN